MSIPAGALCGHAVRHIGQEGRHAARSSAGTCLCVTGSIGELSIGSNASLAHASIVSMSLACSVGMRQHLSTTPHRSGGMQPPAMPPPAHLGLCDPSRSSTTTPYQLGPASSTPGGSADYTYTCPLLPAPLGPCGPSRTASLCPHAPNKKPVLTSSLGRYDALHLHLPSHSPGHAVRGAWRAPPAASPGPQPPHHTKLASALSMWRYNTLPLQLPSVSPARLGPKTSPAPPAASPGPRPG